MTVLLCEVLWTANHDEYLQTIQQELRRIMKQDTQQGRGNGAANGGNMV